MEYVIRKAICGDENGIVDVNIKTWKSAYKGIIDNTYLDSLDNNKEERKSRIRQRITETEIYVAVYKGEIIGFAIYGSGRDDSYEGYGEIYALYVLKEYQGNGIGRQLVSTVKDDFKKSGYKRFFIVCLSENHSRFFYEKIGGKKAEEKYCTIGEKDYRESIFVYDV